MKKRICDNCAYFIGEAREGFSRCAKNELSNGFIALREYIRPESSENAPCKLWKDKEESYSNKSGAANNDWRMRMYAEAAREDWN